MNYINRFIRTAFSTVQRGGEFDFHKDENEWALNTEKQEKFKEFRLDDNDLANIREFEKIMPQINLDGTLCNTNLKKEATEISMGGFGILFRFICTANGKKYSMKIGLPKNINNSSDWAMYQNEHIILNKFGNKDENPLNGILLPRYYGYVDLTGLNPNAPNKVNYTPSLFKEDLSVLPFKLPSRIMLFFQEWLDGDLNKPLKFNQPIDILYMFLCLLKSLELLVEKNFVHSDLKGGNIMIKKLDDVQISESEYYRAHQHTDRRLFKIIDLGAVVLNGSRIMSYTTNYLDNELASQLNKHRETSKTLEKLIIENAPKSVINATRNKLGNVPPALYSQDVYALAMSFVETLMIAENSLNTDKTLSVMDELYKKKYDADLFQQIIDMAFNLEFGEDKSAKNKDEYSQMNSHIISMCKELLKRMLEPAKSRISVAEARAYLLQEIQKSKILLYYIEDIYEKCVSDY